MRGEGSGGTLTGATVPKQDRSAMTRRRLLDAAVDELLAVGYPGMTTAGVAARAGVSRGAQQHHFPHKQTLVVEAIGHLGSRQLDDLRAVLETLGSGPRSVAPMLDALYEAYCQPLFAVTVELAIAARVDPQLRDAVTEAERAFSREITLVSYVLVEDRVAGDPEFVQRLGMALSTVRGVALLKVLGHSETAVDRQWAFTREALVASLEQGA